MALPLPYGEPPDPGFIAPAQTRDLEGGIDVGLCSYPCFMMYDQNGIEKIKAKGRGVTSSTRTPMVILHIVGLLLIFVARALRFTLRKPGASCIYSEYLPLFRATRSARHGRTRLLIGHYLYYCRRCKRRLCCVIYTGSAEGNHQYIRWMMDCRNNPIISYLRGRRIVNGTPIAANLSWELWIRQYTCMHMNNCASMVGGSEFVGVSLTARAADDLPM